MSESVTSNIILLPYSLIFLLLFLECLHHFMLDVSITNEKKVKYCEKSEYEKTKSLLFLYFAIHLGTKSQKFIQIVFIAFDFAN
jgi:hypothetical protein